MSFGGETGAQLSTALAWDGFKRIEMKHHTPLGNIKLLVRALNILVILNKLKKCIALRQHALQTLTNYST